MKPHHTQDGVKLSRGMIVFIYPYGLDSDIGENVVDLILEEGTKIKCRKEPTIEVGVSILYFARSAAQAAQAAQRRQRLRIGLPMIPLLDLMQGNYD